MQVTPTQTAERSAEATVQARGAMAMVVLGVLTIVEFIVAINIDSTTLVVLLLVVMALAKAWIIVRTFMHVTKLWQGEGDHA